MTILSKRWNDPISNTDGWRVLICRYRPRGLLKKDETWDIWLNQLAPSPQLHAKAYGKLNGKPLSWEKYRLSYLKEMNNKQSKDLIQCLAKLFQTGETITLLCSSACKDENLCHRSILKKLIEDIGYSNS